MAIDNPVHINECGLPLNAIEWLETHHRCKLTERVRMVRDLQLPAGSRIVDAGCGPGLWTPLLASALGSRGSILGVDVSEAALVTARQRMHGQWCSGQVSYVQADVENLPLTDGAVHTIFSANVCQYLPDPVKTFAALGRYLLPGGRLAMKDIDFGTICFHHIDAALQSRVFQARERWEKQRLVHGLLFEDSWVGSRLAGYMRTAGYTQVCEKTYTINRQFPLSPEARVYIQGIGLWFVCENAPLLSSEDRDTWLQAFEDGPDCVLDREGFGYEETEYLAFGEWPEHLALARLEEQLSLLQHD
jgi:ubiquinone/menaquinone biosynthesis C-methylase UbiE